LFFSISTVWPQSLTSEADSNRMMRQIIAQANSRNMLAKPAAGNHFTYSKDNGVSSFTVNTAAALQGVATVSMDSPDGKSIIIVSSAEVDVEKPAAEDIVSVSLDFSMEDDEAETGYLSDYMIEGLAAMRQNGGKWNYLINELLDGMMYGAVVQAVEETGVADKTVDGTVYI
jgi:hypothetical protein